MSMYYTKEHEWVRVEGDVGTVGVTPYAAGQLGDVVFVDLPAVGASVEQGSDMAVVESVKAASDVYAPVSGEVVEANGTLTSAPETVNADAEGEGWFCKIKLSKPEELTALMDQAAYAAFCESL